MVSGFVHQVKGVVGMMNTCAEIRILRCVLDLHAIDATLVDIHTGVDWISARFFARASGVGDVLATNVAVDVSEMPAPARFIR